VAQRRHARHGLHTQAVSEIFGLGLQSSLHIGRKLLKWLHHHHRVVLLPLTFPLVLCLSSATKIGGKSMYFKLPLLVTLVPLVERPPMSALPDKRGRPLFYLDRLFLKALVL